MKIPKNAGNKLMHVQQSLVDDVIVLQPQGRIDGATSSSFEEQCMLHIGAGAQHVVIDLSGIDYVSSAGLRALLITAKKTKSTGGALTLCSAHGSVKEVISLSGFDSLLGAHETTSDAIAALKK